MEYLRARRIRFLLQRESESESPALEPGQRTSPVRRSLCAPGCHPDVQRLCRSGRQPLQRHGPEEEFLAGFPDQPPMNAILSSKWSKVFVFLLCLVPFGLLFHRFYLAQWGGQLDALTANPQQFIEDYTGDWVLLFLVFTLCITPLRKIPGLSALIRYRRMLGLYAFFYVCLHFTTWLALDRYFDWSQMVDD